MVSDRKGSLTPPHTDPLDGRVQVVVTGRDVPPRRLHGLMAHQVGDGRDGGAGVGRVAVVGIRRRAG
jgi:hypothetical protein